MVPWQNYCVFALKQLSLSSAARNSLAQHQSQFGITEQTYDQQSTSRPSSVWPFCSAVFHERSHSVRNHFLTHCHCWRPLEQQQHPPRHHQHLIPADLCSAALAVAVLTVVSSAELPATPLCMSTPCKLHKHTGWLGSGHGSVNVTVTFAASTAAAACYHSTRKGGERGQGGGCTDKKHMPPECLGDSREGLQQSHAMRMHMPSVYAVGKHDASSSRSRRRMASSVYLGWLEHVNIVDGVTADAGHHFQE